MAEDSNLRSPDDNSSRVRPDYPPESVLRPEVRRRVLVTFLGGIIAVFAIAGMAWLYYWAFRDGARPGEPADEVPAGTAGEQLPGGFDPQPRPGDTRDEFSDRGTGGPAPGPGTAGRVPAPAASTLHELLRDGPAGAGGRLVALKGIEVASAAGREFQVREGDARATVIVPGASRAPVAGTRVDIAGTAEPDGRGGVRIRATQVTARRP